LIYFYFAWAPDNHALVALACKEGEWDAREKEYKLPAGRPRLIGAIDGHERLLDDQSTEAWPAWSPESAKIATAFDTDVAIYDAGGKTPTQARIPLRDALFAASVAYDQKNSGEAGGAGNGAGGTGGATRNDNSHSAAAGGPSATGPNPASAESVPVSFNPIVRLSWPVPERIFIKTAYVRLFRNDVTNTFQRWHQVVLSPQATVLK